MVTVDNVVDYLTKIRNKRGYVTAEDIHNYLDNHRVYGVNRRLSYINRALNSGAFVPIAMVASSRPKARYRKISVWC